MRARARVLSAHTRVDRIINYRIEVRAHHVLVRTIEPNDTLIYLSKPLIIYVHTSICL